MVSDSIDISASPCLEIITNSGGDIEVIDDIDELMKMMIWNDKQPTFVRFIHLDKTCSPLQHLSVLLATQSRVKGVSIGNVCVAMCEIHNVLYIATNVNDQLADITTLSVNYRRFLDLFETDLESRKRCIKNAELEGMFVGLRKLEFGEEECKFVKDRMMDDDFIRSFHDSISVKCPPREKTSAETDTTVSGFIDLLQQWNNISVEDSSKELETAAFCIEVIALYLPARNDNLFQEFYQQLYQPVLKYYFYKILQAVVRDRRRVQRLIENASTDIVQGLEILASKEEFSMIKGLKESLNSLKFFSKVVFITNVGKIETNPGVLHCEVKLYLYLLEKNIPTKAVPFYISKPLCMDCAMFFYCKVSKAVRPSFRAACNDHFRNVMCATSCGILSKHFNNVRCHGCIAKCTDKEQGRSKKR